MPTFTVKEKKLKAQMNDNSQSQINKDVADALLLQAVTQYKELQALAAFQAAEIKQKMEAPRRIIEMACLVAPENKIIAPTFRASFIETKSLDTEAMIKAIGRPTLRPFITERIDRDAVTKALGEEEVKPFLVGSGSRQLRVS